MTSLTHHRVAPVSPGAWFVVAVPATILSLVIAAIVWSAAGSWLGLSALVLCAAAGIVAAWRTGHDHLAPYVGGAVVTLAGLFVVPLVMAHYYIGN
jgi:hypothetical protein